ncbi:molecular chaperone DnaJ [Hoyosella subflava]|uniref:Chaperone protein DnaJ n=1 Tax=Hoyosella subflava (strain DSM 45089 / JCM 17490 / NBRC 109087 / DQS3-9A1) TaxID=443218 RepID=F6ERR9_HOYSD|nr:molecular chaperone DnaJ [Hoyosella subflava]AEF39646.1 dTDP-glucose 4,6-dehydratase [Hoyosella subflava DQS3-9A1]
MARDYYGTLGVSKTATDQEIKRAYRKLAREFHPDVNPDPAAQERFKDATTAYEILSDPQKRKVVDMGGDPLDGPGGGAGAGFGAQGFGGLGDVFEAFFGGAGGMGSRGPRSRVQPGADALLKVRLDLAECAQGVTKDVTVDTAILCDTCQGSGANGNSKPVQCETCRGAGEIQSVQRSFLGQVMTTRQCPTCNGFGQIIPDPCRKCAGEGRVRARRDIAVRIPAGVANGMRVRLASQGEVGPGGGPAGDLYVEVVEQPHEVFVRDGDSLHCTVKIPMVDAALGTTVTVESLIDGPIELSVEPGTQPGAVATIPGQGMPRLRAGTRGDLYAHLEVVIPTKLDGKQADLLESFRSARGRDAAEVVTSASHHGSKIFSKLRDFVSGR